MGNVGILVAVGIDADGRRGRIRANDMIRRPNREIRRRTRVAGGFPDGSGALMPVCAGIRCVTANGDGRPAAIRTCPGSMTASWKRTDHRAMDGHDPKCATFRTLPSSSLLFFEDTFIR